MPPSFQIIGSTPIQMAGQIHNQSSESTEREWIFRLLFFLYKYRILSFNYMKKVYIFLIENYEGGGGETLK